MKFLRLGMKRTTISSEDPETSERHMAKRHDTLERTVRSDHESRVGELRKVVNLYKFDLNKYSDTPKADLTWWHRQLDVRLMYLRSIRDAPEMKYPRQYLGFALYGLPFLIVDPVPKISSSERSSIRHLRLSDISRLAGSIPAPPPMDALRQEKREYSDRLEQTLFDLYRSNRAKPDRCVVEVSLLAGDDVLKKDLMVLVEKARKGSDIQSRRKKWHNGISRAEVQSWIDGRLLPYVDLRLICGAQMLNSSDSDIGSVLFPEFSSKGGTDWPGIADRMKTPRALFKRVVNQTFLSFLGTQKEVVS
jgi:hypothetical protein